MMNIQWNWKSLEIDKIINTSILIYSIFEDKQSKSESELREHIKNFLPNKKNNDNTT